MLKRIVQAVACFGIQTLVLIQTNRVEKSFWQSPSAQSEAMRQQLIIGLEQANATQLPDILTFKGFRNFIEDECPALSLDAEKIVLHPGDHPLLPAAAPTTKTVICIGPEGGFTQYEYDRWLEQGFTVFQLGERILKVETAVTAVLGRLLG